MGEAVPPALMRYLAWAAARSLPMQHLDLEWAVRYPNLFDSPVIEPPPDGLMRTLDRSRDLKLIHPTLGERTIAKGDNIPTMLDEGWIPDPTDRDNFLEGVTFRRTISKLDGFLG
jgi:hypothetical protein